MKLIVGLGNPGEKYENTRHNIGWKILDILAEKQKWKTSKNAPAFYYKKNIDNQLVELLKPTTFMNESGKAVSYVIKKHNIPLKDVVVIHDDKDLLLGEYKIQNNRGSAGHNGIKSIIEHLKTKDFTRIRIGVGRKDKITMGDTAKFVLNKFNKEEKKVLEKITPNIIKEIESLVSY